MKRVSPRLINIITNRNVNQENIGSSDNCYVVGNDHGRGWQSRQRLPFSQGSSFDPELMCLGHIGMK